MGGANELPEYIKLKVHSGARKAELNRKAADSCEIWVKSPAERGLANAEAVKLLAAELGVAPGRIRIIKGAHSPAKIARITGT